MFGLFRTNNESKTPRAGSSSRDTEPTQSTCDMDSAIARPTPELAKTMDQTAASPSAFGRYEIRRVIGRGAYGDVYLGYDPVLKREVAIKSPRFSNERFESATEAFLREARTLARLNHENIVAVHDTGRTRTGQPYIVMEYIDGMSLSHVAYTPETRSANIGIVKQIAAALDYAHKKGLVHRDLKPGNVLVTHDGVAKVCDFGMAIDDQLRVEGELAGTPSYMSPEQVLGKSHLLDGRTDIWSLGVILYQCLTGVRPFTASTQRELFVQILNRPARPPSQLDGSIDKSLEAICLRCLEKDVAKRPAHAREVLTALHDAVPGGKRKGVVGWWATGILLCGILLLAVGGGAWWMSNLARLRVGLSSIAPSRPRMSLTPLAWGTTEATDYYDLAQDTGRITVKSTSYRSCFETHQPKSDRYQVRVSGSFQSELGLAGIALGIHPTSKQPDEYRCWTFAVSRNYPGRGSRISVEDCAIGLNELRHMDFRRRHLVAEFFLDDTPRREFELMLHVDRERIINVTCNDEPVTDLIPVLADLRIPSKAGCGIVALSHVVFHNLTCKELP